MTQSAGHHRHVQHHWMGAFYAVLAALFTALLGLFVKLIGDRASTNTVVFVRYFVGFLFILPWALKNPKETIVVHKPMQVIFRSTVSLFAMATFFYALKFIPITNALVLNNSSPLFVPLFRQFAHKKTTNIKVWMGIFLGFLGLVFVIRPDPHEFHIHSLYALLSGIAGAVATILIRQLTKTCSVTQIVFYNFLTGVVVTAVLLPFFAEVENWVSLIPLFLALGLCGTASSHFTTLSLAKAPAQAVAPIIFLAVIFGVPLDYIFWGDTPHWITCIGIAAVIIGGIITIHYGQKSDIEKGKNLSN